MNAKKIHGYVTEVNAKIYPEVLFAIAEPG